MSGDVKFIRVNGKVIPIHGKGPPNIRVPKIKPHKDFKDTSGSKFSVFGSTIGTFGFLAGFGGNQTQKFALKKVMHATYPAESLKFEKLNKIARVVTKTGRKFEVLGAGIFAAGVGLGAYQYFNQNKK